MQIPFVDLKTQYKNLKFELDAAVLNVMENGTFIMGKPVTDFEARISEYLGVPALGCASGSDALLLALTNIGVGPGDEVITSPFTFFATAGAVARLGATPVFVDIDEHTFNITAETISEAINEKTKAIIPVHIYGQPVSMGPIMELAQKHGIKVIEDACQAIGSEYKGRKAGTIGDYGCFSFFPTKNLGGAGDGGLITAKNPEDFERVKVMRVHGSKVKYHHDFVGINSRLDALQAAVLGVKLKYLDEWNTKRMNTAKRYNEELKELVTVPTISEDVKHISHLYTIKTDRRDELQNFLHEKDIATGVYYPVPLHLQKCFADLGYKEGDLPITEKVCKEVLSIAIYPEMTDEQVTYVIESVKQFFSNK